LPSSPFLTNYESARAFKNAGQVQLGLKPRTASKIKKIVSVAVKHTLASMAGRNKAVYLKPLLLQSVSAKFSKTNQIASWPGKIKLK